MTDIEIGIYNKNMQVYGKQTPDDKQISIHKKSSVFSAFGARNYRYFERLLFSSYSANDQNE